MPVSVAATRNQRRVRAGGDVRSAAGRVLLLGVSTGTAAVGNGGSASGSRTGLLSGLALHFRL